MSSEQERQELIRRLRGALSERDTSFSGDIFVDALVVRGAIAALDAPFEYLLDVVRALPDEQRHEVAKAAGVACWSPWHRQGFK